MKVTVAFGRTAVVVPCKDNWTVRDLLEQATVRYKKLSKKGEDVLVRTQRIEYSDGGILDPDDLLTDLVEDKEKLVAVYEEQEALRRGDASAGGSNVMAPPRQELSHSRLSAFRPIKGSEIEIDSTVIKSRSPLLVRYDSEPSPTDFKSTQPGGPSEPPQLMEEQQVPTDMGGTDRGEDVRRTGSSTLSDLTRTVEISGDPGPLGIHVVPYCSSLSGRPLGLLIRGIEENSRSSREDFFCEEECIVKINETELMDKSFAQSQELFRQAMRSPTVYLHVLPAVNKERYEKTLIGQIFLPESQDDTSRAKIALPLKAKPDLKPPTLQVHPEEPEARQSPIPQRRTPDVPVIRVSPPPPTLLHPTQPSPTPRERSHSPLAKTSPNASPLMFLTNRKRVQVQRIDLIKGGDGLGFTVIARDPLLHGLGPIFVKSIMSKGAAVRDGRLRSGDRILEVNGLNMAGRTQDELVAMLRSTRQGESVSLVVERQERGGTVEAAAGQLEEHSLPRELKGEKVGRVSPMVEGMERLLLEIPLNDSGSAGLGVSLKGNRSRETGEDLGIFVKSIMHGGAAYKDGRLRADDQLLEVNGEVLLGRSNYTAMETLRHSMSTDGNLRGTIQLVVGRVPDRDLQENHEKTRSPVQSRSTPSPQPRSGNQAPKVMTKKMSEVSPGWCVKDSPPLPPRPPQLQRALLHPRFSREPHCLSGVQQRQLESMRACKSLDLEEEHQALSPTTGLKKSGSLESLQTARWEMPYQSSQVNVVRVRGCNRSFRAAVDRSYDGPLEPYDDDLSDTSSGWDTPTSGSSRREVEHERKDKKKTRWKKKDKSKGKAKSTSREGSDSVGEPGQTVKRRFGLFRFSKKRREKDKAGLPQTGILNVEEIDGSQTSHRECQATEDDSEQSDPSYEQIDYFRHAPPSGSNRTPTPMPPPNPQEAVYATVNKLRAPPTFLRDRTQDRTAQGMWENTPAPIYANLQQMDDCGSARFPRAVLGGTRGGYAPSI